MKVLSHPAFPDDRKCTAFQMVPRVRPFVPLVRATKMSTGQSWNDNLALIVIKDPVRTAQ
jgi:hypothetical protein